MLPMAGLPRAARRNRITYLTKAERAEISSSNNGDKTGHSDGGGGNDDINIGLNVDQMKS